MRILSFQKEFKDKLLSGAKVSTMRVHKRPHKVGEIVQVYCPSPRSGKGVKLFDAEILKVEKAELCEMDTGEEICQEVVINDKRLDCYQEHSLAIKEGFEDIQSLFRWFLFHNKDLLKPQVFTRYVFKKVEG